MFTLQETLASRLTHAPPTLAGMVELVSHSTHSMCANAWKVFTERPASRMSMSANRIRAKMVEPVLTALDHSPVCARVVSLAISARTHMCHAILRRAKMGAPAGRPTTPPMIAPAYQVFISIIFESYFFSFLAFVNFCHAVFCCRYFRFILRSLCNDLILHVRRHS